MFFASPSLLKNAGILGMNKRNHHFINKYNQRKLFPLVDDKLKTKKLAADNGFNVPELYGVVSHLHEMNKKLPEILAPNKSFVIKPTKGSGGNGILVINKNHGDYFLKSSGQTISIKEIKHHIANILSGLYSLSGQKDHAMIEYKIEIDKFLKNISSGGIPDIRLIVFKGFPVMAMIRIPTIQSDGKANLHQGAVGVGIDIIKGTALQAVIHNKVIHTHPDNSFPLNEIAITEWYNLLKMAAQCYELTGLGYLGVDIVVDKRKGPMILELNARPGLSIQTANGTGLKNRLQEIESLKDHNLSPVQRIEFMKSILT